MLEVAWTRCGLVHHLGYAQFLTIPILTQATASPTPQRAGTWTKKMMGETKTTGNRFNGIKNYLRTHLGFQFDSFTWIAWNLGKTLNYLFNWFFTRFFNLLNWRPVKMKGVVTIRMPTTSKATATRDHPHMTYTKFLDFVTPCPLVHISYWSHNLPYFIFFYLPRLIQTFSDS